MAESRSKPTLSRRKFLLAGAAAGLSVAAMGDIGSRDVVIERRTLTLPKWDAKGFKIALLADLHLRDQVAADRARHAHELAVAEKPDLIINVGDFVSKFQPMHRAFIKHALEPLHDAKCPCVGILGNHDYGSQVPEIVHRAVSSVSPMNILVNETMEVHGVSIVGMDDCLISNPDWNVPRERAFSRSFLSLVHEPDYVVHNPETVSLQLSGHSHGGQICLPGGHPIVTPYGSRKYVSGFYPDADVPLYVSRGIGTTGPKWRIFCPPELTILTLQGG